MAAAIYHERKTQHLGTFGSEEDAAAAASAAREAAPLRKQTSKHRGVHWRQGKWAATIWLGGKRKHLGVFGDEAAAAAAYRRAAAERDA